MSEELEDIQGNVLRGYAKLPHGALLLIEIRDARSGRAWLAEQLPRVTTEGAGKPGPVALNIALSHDGLRVLGLPGDLLAAFPGDFRAGMAARAERLGDVGANGPREWDEGLRPESDGHALVLLRAGDPVSCGEAAARAQRRIDSYPGLQCVYDETGGPLEHSNEAVEMARGHFGFADGYSQPAIEGTPPREDGQSSPPAWAGAPDGNGGWREIKAGEFLLGHKDEDGIDAVPALPFHANGTFLVFRKLQQNVAAFRATVNENARALLFAQGREATAAELERVEPLVAAKIMGRWDSGAPLALYPDAPPPPSEQVLNDFGYRTDDFGGFRCPLGAHIRRTNPRDALVGGAERALRHRIVRRGMSYGKRLPPGAGDDGSRGLLFICFNASIARQFEVVQSWCVDGNLFDVPDEPDFVLGAADEASSTMTLQGTPPRYLVRRRRLVETRGGGYFFYPGLRALRALANADYSEEAVRAS